MENNPKIAISGLGIISSIGLNAEETHQSLISKKSGIGAISLLKTSLNVPAGEIKLTNEDLKNLLGLNPKRVYSRTALLGMFAAKQATDDAGLNFQDKRVGIISATSVGGMDLTETFYPAYRNDCNSGRISLVSHHDCADSTLAIAKYCGIKDFSTTISTACSSAANAIMLGARMLKANLLDIVIAGGTDALCKFTLNGFNSLMILDKDKCRPFDETRSGLNLGEGAAYIVMQRQNDLQRNSYGYLVGYANANDATHQTATSEDGKGAFLSMNKALSIANLSPHDIDYINAHGTGTGNNDASEAAAILNLFKDVPAFSSTKAYTGHTLAAAGAIEAVISLLAIKHQTIYPNLNFKCPMVSNTIIPVIEPASTDIKNIMSNSFGFGGNCSTLIFQKA